MNHKSILNNYGGDFDSILIQPTQEQELAYVNYDNSPYNLSTWWNQTYKYRIGFELRETKGINRSQPIDVPLNFNVNEFYPNTSRLLGYNLSGDNQWSNLIPHQVWNITKYQSANYIESCTITFIVNITANTNKTYFLYYNDDLEGIGPQCLESNFSSVLSNGILNVTAGKSQRLYNVVIEEGSGVSELIYNGINFHSAYSMTPARQLTHPNLELMAHFDEGSGDEVIDSSINGFNGEFRGNLKWSSGIIEYGVEFDGEGDYITFDDVLNYPIGSTSKFFTLSTWINPKSFTNSQSNHGTMNCFVAKASKPYNDNLELGIYKVNETHGLLQVYISTASFENSSRYGDVLNNPILVDSWNFISVKYNEGDVAVVINDILYEMDINNTEPWNGANYLGVATGSHFTVGGTINSDIYFNGTIDILEIYNKSLDFEEIESNKLAYRKSKIKEISELENGCVFSRYQINWYDVYDMHISDIMSFYNDYNLWNLERSVYFDNRLDLSKVEMSVLNTNYNLSEIDERQDGFYIYDGFIKENLSKAGFVVENYTIIHNAPDMSKETLGMFIEGYHVSNLQDSSVSDLKGEVSYYNDSVNYSPGSIINFDNNNGGSDNKLIIDFWEYINSVNQSGVLDNINFSLFFNDTLVSLRVPINIHIFYREPLLFKLSIYVEDIDSNPVKDAIISLYNLTDGGKLDSLVKFKSTDLNGTTSFFNIGNGTYRVNITYENYGQPEFQIIQNQINININKSLASKNGDILYKFLNVSITTLRLYCKRLDPITLEIKENVVNANVSFWLNNGSGEKYVGYELTDKSGEIEFHWLNFTSPNEGNITFSVTWYDELLDISAKGDLSSGFNKKITLPYYKENQKIVNVSSYEFYCVLVEYNQDPVKFGEEITFRVNYTYTINYTNPKPINEAKIYGYIEQEGINISSISLEFIESGLNGTYELKINTTDPIDPQIEFNPLLIYKIHIQAFKEGYIPKIKVQLIQFSILNTKLTLDKTKLDVHWKDNATINLYYEDISTDPSTPIDSATINYTIIGLPNINGTVLPNGTEGWYMIIFNTTILFPETSYSINIMANKKGYEIKIEYIDLNILKMRTLINGSMDLGTLEKTMYLGDNFRFRFSYVDALKNLTILDLENKSYIWRKYSDLKVLLDNGQGNLTLDLNNLYALDLNNIINQKGYYELFITLSKSNFITQSIKLFLTIEKRYILYSLSDNFKDRKIVVNRGKSVVIEITLIDPTKGYAKLTGAKVDLEIDDETYKCKEVDEGVYKYTFETNSYNTFFQNKTFSGKIVINKQYYISEDFKIKIIITIDEIFPGMPIFYFLNFIIPIGIITLILIIYRIKLIYNLPKSIKDLRRIKNSIKNGKKISK